MIKNILFIYGTRPEAIKMAPLVHELCRHPDSFAVEICLTGQHREMLDQVNAFFGITGDYNLSIMSPNQTLFDVTSKALLGMEKVLDQAKPDLVFVQGDTTTVFAGALAAFYKQIKVAHLEAGLRSGNKLLPFPEEINRSLTGQLSDFHFAPTEQAVSNLRNEGITKNVWNVGNTVIDALFLGLENIQSAGMEQNIVDYLSSLIPNFDKIVQDTKNGQNRVVLVTGHRRESFGLPFENMCNAMLDIVNQHKDVQLIYPVHLNPNVQNTVKKMLQDHPRIHLIDPLDYPSLIWLEQLSYIILTDSGGIQEEGPSLGKPVLVMRDVTERIEGIEAKTAKLVGTNRKLIVSEAGRLLSDPAYYNDMSQATNPYGDGTTSRRIAEILKDREIWK